MRSCLGLGIEIFMSYETFSGWGLSMRWHGMGFEVFSKGKRKFRMLTIDFDPAKLPQAKLAHFSGTTPSVRDKR